MYLKTFLRILFALILIAQSPIIASAENIANADFEVGGAGWEFGDHASITQDESQVFAGGKALRFNFDASIFFSEIPIPRPTRATSVPFVADGNPISFQFRASGSGGISLRFVVIARNVSSGFEKTIASIVPGCFSGTCSYSLKQTADLSEFTGKEAVSR